MEIPRLGPISIVTLIVLLSVSIPRPARAAPRPDPCPEPAAHAFDFWIGDWDVLNRSRRRGDPEWYETGRATDRVYPVLDGCGIVESWRGVALGRFFVGFSLRAWNPDSGRWELVLLWPGPNRPSFGVLEGGFRHGRGEFFFTTRDTAGTEIRHRYTFSDITPDALRWDAAFSRGGGLGWSTTWIMEFDRRPATADPLFNGPTSRSDRCTLPELDAFGPWTGEWRGRAEGVGEGPAAGASDADSLPARAHAYRILDGCGFMDFVQIGDGDDALKIFRVRTYEPTSKAWVEYRMDTATRRIQRLTGTFQGETVTLQSPEGPDAAGAPPRLLTRWTTLSQDSVAWETSVLRDGRWVPVRRVSLERDGSSMAPSGP